MAFERAYAAPTKTRLSDAWAAINILFKVPATKRGNMWPYDFTNRGLIRAPRSPTVWVSDMETNTTFHIVFAGYRVLGGLTAVHNMPWLVGDVPAPLSRCVSTRSLFQTSP